MLLLGAFVLPGGTSPKVKKADYSGTYTSTTPGYAMVQPPNARYNAYTFRFTWPQNSFSSWFKVTNQCSKIGATDRNSTDANSQVPFTASQVPANADLQYKGSALWYSNSTAPGSPFDVTIDCSSLGSDWYVNAVGLWYDGNVQLMWYYLTDPTQPDPNGGTTAIPSGSGTTPAPTAAPSPSDSPTAAPSPSDSPTAAPSPSPSATSTPAPTDSPSPSNTPAPLPSDPGDPNWGTGGQLHVTVPSLDCSSMLDLACQLGSLFVPSQSEVDQTTQWIQTDMLNHGLFSYIRPVVHFLHDILWAPGGSPSNPDGSPDCHTPVSGDPAHNCDQTAYGFDLHIGGKAIHFSMIDFADQRIVNAFAPIRGFLGALVWFFMFGPVALYFVRISLPGLFGRD